MFELYIGLMSGTSLDGIDAALVKFDKDDIKVVDFTTTPFSDSIKKNIQTLSRPDTPIALKQYGSLDTQLGELFATSARQLLKKNAINPVAISAIGSHGQTLCHAPEKPFSFSLQIGNPNIIAERTGISTVADFRRRDIAANGQGAPLVPAFHHAIFCKLFDLSKQAICIVNIGGIANISYLTENKVLGFDTGPGNTLMDYWAKKHINKNYDKGGAWATSGCANPQLVRHLKQDPYFKKQPPKSTGKEQFSVNWLENKLANFVSCKAVDIQASLCQLTADTITEAIQRDAPLTKQTLICGGGVHNDSLIQLINNNLEHPVETTAKYGINPDAVEATAFAWLARQTIYNLAGNLTQVTGARKSVILGGIYPGENRLNGKTKPKMKNHNRKSCWRWDF